MATVFDDCKFKHGDLVYHLADKDKTPAVVVNQNLDRCPAGVVQRSYAIAVWRRGFSSDGALGAQRLIGIHECELALVEPGGS